MTAPEHSEWVPTRFVDRIGAALVAPRQALAAVEARPEAGKTASDLIALIGLGFLAVKARQLVAIGWLGVVDGPGIALGNLLNAISRAVATDLTFLFVAAIALTLTVGRRRSLARDFDLACVALVPFVTVELVTSLVVWLAPGLASNPAGQIVGVVAYGWALAVLILAWRLARKRPPPASAEPTESEGSS